MPAYDEQQGRFARAFDGIRTCCVIDCDCGRVHFVSAQGHGDYEEGELEGLQKKAEAEPQKYVEHCDFDYVDAALIDGRYIVPDCPCGKYKRYCDWIEHHAEGLSRYLVKFFEEKRKDAEREAADAARHLHSLSSAESLTQLEPTQ